MSDRLIMVDKNTQCNFIYYNYFEMLFDDIFTLHEDMIVPLNQISENLNLETRKKQRTEKVEAIKRMNIKRSVEDLTEARKKSELTNKIVIAPEVFAIFQRGTEKLTEQMRSMLLEKRLEQAYSPLDIDIPHLTSVKHMHQWLLGGPCESQYELFCHLLKLPRDDALPWFMEMAASYFGFCDKIDELPKTRSALKDALKEKIFSIREEKQTVQLFFASKKEPEPELKPKENVETLGKVFLKLSFLTAHNKSFKTFVRKCFEMDAKVRETLTCRFLFRRLQYLNGQFYSTKLMKYNYLRIAWERKSGYMDDYSVCLILFIHDKTSNISWDEADEIIYPIAKDIIQRSFQSIRRSVEPDRRFPEPDMECSLSFN